MEMWCSVLGKEKMDMGNIKAKKDSWALFIYRWRRNKVCFDGDVELDVEFSLEKNKMRL